MDAGVSLNPAIDIGQIEGAFIQGYGLLTTEEILWDEEGRFLTDAFQKYRIPTTATLPKKFRMMLLDKPNTYGVAIYSAKGTGEPLLLLGQSVFHAMERAVLAFAKNPQKVKPFASPLTSAKIRAYAKQYL
ncbi:hypothetical protein L596_014255 [Steinernema carpocapsae]|nr:hypothetical protein L596_014255 [Steinernema carpocapsae]